MSRSPRSTPVAASGFRLGARLRAGVAGVAILAFAAPALAHPGHEAQEAPQGPGVMINGPQQGLLGDLAPELLFEPVETAATATTGGGLQAERFGTWGVDLTQRRADIAPGTDFFRHINGVWLDNFQIPADRSDYGSFNALGELSERQVKALIEEAAAARAKSGPNQQIGDLYASFMDEARIDRLGVRPLRPELVAIGRARTAPELLIALARLPGAPTPFGWGVSFDRRDTTKHQLNLYQGGLGMPERDFYLSDGSNFPQVRAAYLTYLETLFTLWGLPEAQAKTRAAAVLAFETEIAKVHWTRADNRDPTKTFNVRTLSQWEAEAPGAAWRDVLAASGVDLAKVTDLNVFQPSAIAATAAVWNATPVDTLRAWASVRLLASSADMLPRGFRDAAFRYQQAQTGQAEQRSRAKRGGDFVSGALGDAIGQLYVAKHFPPEAKAAIDELVVNVKAAMGRRIDALEWMGPETKVRAREKLAAFGVKIGYPEVWDDTSGVVVRRDDLIGNARRFAAWARQDNLGRLGKPVDKREWVMTPQTVNAYYMPPNNEIVFPAAILQPPFFDFRADPAVNYGGIGGVIGHEISHGFDDSGRRFAADGSQTDWWTAEDNARFQTRADQLVAQYDKFEPLPGLFLQGRVSLGENIADLAGLTVALDAYRASLGGKEAPVIDGLTGEQRFFMGWGQVWRFKARDERMRQRVATAPHSPPQFRVNGVVRNIDAWYQAFDVKPGDALYVPVEQRVRIW
jgi:putative endopeptidase